MEIDGRRIVDLSMPMFDGMPSGGPRATYSTWETHEATREWFGTYSYCSGPLEKGAHFE